jgi:hypothetical protein
VIAAAQLTLDFDEPSTLAGRPTRRPRLSDASIDERGRVVRDAIRRRELDPYLGLLLVVCPESEFLR